MQKLFIASLFLFCLTVLTSAQTENPVKQTVSYSESKPYQERQFPVKKEGTNSKKDKKSKKKKEETVSPPMPAQADAAPLPAAADSVKPLSQNLIEKTVTIPVSVFNSNGYFVSNLAKSDFQVFADGQEQQILEVITRSEPVSLILLVDTSPSTAYRIEEIQNYAQAVVNKLQPEDRVMVIAFNQKTEVLSELTADRRVTAKAIGKLQFGDGTSLYEAVEKTFDKYVSQIPGIKTVVLLTDGVDTTSQRSGYRKSLITVEQSDAAVYSIYFNTFIDYKQSRNSNGINGMILGSILNSRGIKIGGGAGATAADYELGRMYLADISALSGGRARQIKNIKDIKAENIDNLGLELRAQYQISFRTASLAAKQRKQVIVRVNQPNLFVQARGSLIAGGSD